MERWIEIYDFPGYMVSDWGRVRQVRSERILSISRNKNNVLKVNLMKNGRYHTRSLARLVCTAFHGEGPEGSVVEFADYNTTNCTAENLSWNTRSFIQERTVQHRRTEPMRPWKILREATGEIYDNSLLCAIAVDGIEKYIVLAAGDPLNRRYRGSSYRWIRE